MSTSTFVITVIDRPKPNWSIWRVRNTTAGGANDFVNTRSFVLDAISTYSSELAEKLKEVDLTSESWYEKNVEKYIEYVTFFAEVNEQPNDIWPNNLDELMSTEYQSEKERESELCKTLHHVYLAIECTNPSYLDKLPEVFETMAFDWWEEDPAREPISYCVSSFNTNNLGELKEELSEFIELIKDSKYP
ncbi:hypothetical protein [Mesoflavibacter zeaxanthinifaciens]|uniref:hypothetical protein n=1 Tax=Mesoflavibacter zeaxanthinifaciens TaxID=393060 RepID=UPI003A9132AF